MWCDSAVDGRAGRWEAVLSFSVYSQCALSCFHPADGSCARHLASIISGPHCPHYNQ